MDIDFKHIDKKYRPIPFWSWNTRLDCDETRRQIRKMNDVGMGGFFMHARGGLTTEYMSKEWFDNVSASIDEAKKLGMHAWAYDENGWPSGFGNGIVNGMGIEYQQKYLRMEDGEKNTDTTICNINGKHFYYEVNPFYVDTLNETVVKVFIEKIYVPYYERYGNNLEGFFTDEPQVSRNGIPWSFILPEEYKKANGEEIFPILPQLFEDTGDYKNSRIKFWKLITDLFSKSYSKQIYDWCVSRNMQFTGHFCCEDRLCWQITSNGAVMPHYEYFTIPGMDCLGRELHEAIFTPHQLGSVAQQLEKKQVLAENFALCGHNVSFSELRRITEWQMVHGITLLCPHLQGYSLQGIRKRDYPPAMYYQQPWWDEYKIFIDAMSRIGMLLTEGEVKCDTLLIHPETYAWTIRTDGYTPEIEMQFYSHIKTLEEKHILYHLGDETIMERHARVVGKTLVLGTQIYDKIVLPDYIDFLPSTKALLSEYKNNGGVIIKARDIPKNNIIDNKNITYTKRIYKNYDIHYFVNTTAEEQKSFITKGNKIVDIKTGDLTDFDGNYTFAPYDSLVVYDDRTDTRKTLNTSLLKTLDIDTKWNIENSTENLITLDFCDYYFDDELIEENGYVLNIQHRACELKRPVKIKCVYRFNCKYIPKNLHLVCETPEVFNIYVNGKKLSNKDNGYIVDYSFRKINIADYVVDGINEIVLSANFVQSEKTYENIENSFIFETEKNKLSYDMEIEPIYLCGDFAVYAENEFTQLNLNAERVKAGFILTKPATEISLKNIEKQGYLFFSGRIKLTKEFDIDDTNCRLVFNKTGINAINVYVNGSLVENILWAPFQCDISKYVKKGKNIITLEIVNNLRNLMGPHHLADGESYTVGPGAFYKEPCVWNKNPQSTWDDDYVFVEVSVI